MRTFRLPYPVEGLMKKAVVCGDLPSPSFSVLEQVHLAKLAILVIIAIWWAALVLIR